MILSINMQEIASKLLSKLVNSGEFALFMLAYESNFQELKKSNEYVKSDDCSCFQEYCKVFTTRKKSNKNNQHHDEEIFKCEEKEDILLKNTHLWESLVRDDLEYCVWLKKILITGFLQSGLVKNPIISTSIAYLERSVICCEKLIPHIFLSILLEKDDHIDTKVKLGRNLNAFMSISPNSVTKIRLNDFKRAFKLLTEVVEFLIESSIKRSKFGF